MAHAAAQLSLVSAPVPAVARGVNLSRLPETINALKCIKGAVASGPWQDWYATLLEELDAERQSVASIHEARNVVDQTAQGLARLIRLMEMSKTSDLSGVVALIEPLMMRLEDALSTFDANLR